jgi:hypothetical protein
MTIPTIAPEDRWLPTRDIPGDVVRKIEKIMLD